LENVAQVIGEKPVSEIELESVGFPSVFHGHSMKFGHDKRQVLTGPSKEWLFSQCFCDGCIAAADSAGVKMERAKERVQKLLEKELKDPSVMTPSLGTLIASYPELSDLFAFREMIVEKLIETITQAAPDTDLTCYTRAPDDHWHGWPSGITPTLLDRHVDRIKPLCYVEDPRTARDWLRYYDRLVDCSIDAGITLDPTIIRTEDELRTMVETLAPVVDGQITVYNHDLMSDAHLNWIERLL
jgi:hypothetical protein